MIRVFFYYFQKVALPISIVNQSEGRCGYLIDSSTVVCIELSLGWGLEYKWDISETHVFGGIAHRRHRLLLETGKYELN